MQTMDIVAIPGGGTLPLPPQGQEALRRVAEEAERLNNAIAKAVEAGVTVELRRHHRHHDGRGAWGDQMIPAIALPNRG